MNDLDPGTNPSSGVDIQVFPESGVWNKPPRAVCISIVLQGGNAGDGTKGQTTACSLSPDELPDHLDVEIGRGGQPDGDDGYAIIVTELRAAREGAA